MPLMTFLLHCTPVLCCFSTMLHNDMAPLVPPNPPLIIIKINYVKRVNVQASPEVRNDSA